MQFQLRSPGSEDWEAIRGCADASLPWHPKGNEEWVQNRMRFDTAKYERRHYVAEDIASNEVVAYGSIESGPVAGRFRVFVVMDARMLPEAGEVLYRQLREDLKSLGANVAWVREEARDVNVLGFFQQHGFVGANQYQTPGGLEVVMLEQHLGESH